MRPHIRVDDSDLAVFCRKNHIRRLAFFGSVLRGDFRPDSDIDILVEFEPGRVPGLGFFALQDELGQMLGHKVDLHTPASLSSYFRDQVLREAEPAYVAA
jgi:predicted nucleotidyltransferase